MMLFKIRRFIEWIVSCIQAEPTQLGPIDRASHYLRTPAPSQSQSHITTDSHSASPSWCQAPIWDPWPIFLSPWDFLLDSCGYFVAPSLTRGRACNLLLLLVLASAVPLGSALSDVRSGLSFVSFLSISLQHKIGRINQAQHKPSARVKKTFKTFKELHTYEA
jgi:hypothetical protein